MRDTFQSYDKSLLALFELYCKFDPPPATSLSTVPLLSLSAFKSFGLKTGLVPSILPAQDLIFIYKSMIKSKMQSEREAKSEGHQSLGDAQGTRLGFNEFKEALLKIACLGKYKIGGGP